jgi:hypothetical protein
MAGCFESAQPLPSKRPTLAPITCCKRARPLAIPVLVPALGPWGVGILVALLSLSSIGLIRWSTR